MRARAVLPLFRGLLSSQCYKSAFRSYRKLPRLEDLPDAHLLPLIALVGRPNVGKSALFNRLVRKRDALVYDTPSDHVTRDYREGLAQLGDLQFRVIDTSGLEPAAPPTSLQGRAAALTRGVLQSSHGVIMMLDARQGVVPADEELLQWLRRIRLPAPVMLLANKADTAAGRNNLDQIQADLAALGVADSATPISATSGDGLTDLYQMLQPVVDAAVEQQQQQQQQQAGSSSSMRHYVPAAYKFSAAPAAAAAGLNQTAVAAMGQQQQQQQEEEELAAELDAAAAADSDEAEVDRLLQQHANHDAAAATDSDSEESEHLKSAHTLQPDHIPSKVSDPGAAAVAAAVAAAEADSVDGDDLDTDEGNQQRSPGPLRLAILGLPNAGKSTLMNTLLGYERSLTGPEPGLTRDPTFGWLPHAGNDIQLVDTAGWKRPTAPAPVQDPTAAAAGVGRAKPTSAVAANSSSSSSSSMSKVLADASLSQAKRALSAVHVVVLLLDAPRLLTIKQAITRLELQIATLALDNGKALIIALNKSDAVPGGPAAAAALRDQVADMLDARFVAAGRLPVVSLSALEGSGTDELMNAVVDAYAKWNKRVSSYKLRASLAKHSLRFYGTGGTSHLLQRIKWAVQVKSRPPTFAVLLRGSDEIDEQGKRFISNVLRQSVGLEGVPLRLYVRYNKRQKQQQPVKPRWHRRRARQ